jgi:hypothetical protein
MCGWHSAFQQPSQAFKFSLSHHTRQVHMCPHISSKNRNCQLLRCKHVRVLKHASWWTDAGWYFLIASPRHMKGSRTWKGSDEYKYKWHSRQNCEQLTKQHGLRDFENKGNPGNCFKNCSSVLTKDGNTNTGAGRVTCFKAHKNYHHIFGWELGGQHTCLLPTTAQ